MERKRLRLEGYDYSQRGAYFITICTVNKQSLLGYKELGRNIWQRSFYDHVIRDEHDYLRVAEYILVNPAKWMEDPYYVPEQ